MSCSWQAHFFGDLDALEFIFARVPAHFATFASQPNLLFQNFHQPRIHPGLLDEIADAALHRLHSESDGGPAGHHHDRRENFARLDAFEQIEPFAARCSVARIIQIHQQKVEFARIERRENPGRRANRLGFIALRFQQQAQCFEHVGLVVRYQNLRNCPALLVDDRLSLGSHAVHLDRPKASRIVARTA